MTIRQGLYEIPQIFSTDHRFDKELFSDEGFGEGFDGMARHMSELTQLDRMIAQEGYLSGNAVAIQEPTVKWVPWYQDPLVIADKIGTDILTASRLIEAWKVIDATPKMVSKFVEWILDKGVGSALVYFRGLAAELDKVSSTENQPGAWLEENGQPVFVEDEPGEQPTDNPFTFRRLHDEGNGRPFLSAKEVDRLNLKLEDSETSFSELKQIAAWLLNNDCMTWHDSVNVWSLYKKAIAAKEASSDSLWPKVKFLANQISLATGKRRKLAKAFLFAATKGKPFNSKPTPKWLAEINAHQRAYLWKVAKG